MPQMQLPIFPDGVEHINAQLDVATFRMITAQFCINGNTTQAEISRAFGVTLISVKRAVKCYREKGVAGFYQEPKRCGAAVLTAEVLEKAQALLDEGLETVGDIGGCSAIGCETRYLGQGDPGWTSA